MLNPAPVHYNKSTKGETPVGSGADRAQVPVTEIVFDVAVTVAEASSKSASGGVVVVGIGSAGKDGREVSSQTVSRVRFSVNMTHLRAPERDPALAQRNDDGPAEGRGQGDELEGGASPSASLPWWASSPFRC